MDRQSSHSSHSSELTTTVLDCWDLDELDDELRGAEDWDVMAVSTLLPEPVEKCWGGGLRDGPGLPVGCGRWEREDEERMYRADQGKTRGRNKNRFRLERIREKRQ